MNKDEHNRFDRVFIEVTHIAVWQPSAYKSALGDFYKGLNVYTEATLSDGVIPSLWCTRIRATVMILHPQRWQIYAIISIQ